MYDFTEITTDKLQLSSHVKVLKAKEYNRYLQAQELVDAAEKKAADIIKQAEQTYQQQKELGYQEGLKQAKQLQSKLMLDTIAQCQRYYKNNEQQLAQLVVQAVRQLIGEFDNVELALNMTRQAMLSISNQRQVTLHIAPSQVDKVKARLGKVMKQFPEVSYAEVVADERVEEGGCLLETKVGVIDATLENQLCVVEEAIYKQLNNEDEQ